MVDTALTLITDALLDLGVLADEETPTASQAAGALRKLNNMIDSWNIESMLVYGAVFNLLPMVPGQSSYTVGPGGNLDIPRPTAIQSISFRDITQPLAQQLDIPVEIFTDRDWQDVPLKNMTSTYPFNGVWVDYDFPLIKLRPNPIPSSSQYSMVVWTSGLISNLTLYQAISLAPGYKRALTANLSVELSPSYQVQVPDVIARIANESKAQLKINNFQLNELTLPSELYGGPWYNIYTDRYKS